MPIIRSAKKKLRKDKKRERFNKRFTNILNSSMKKAKKLPSEKNITEAISVLDKSAKKNIIHKNKAARLKSKLSKLFKEIASRQNQKNKNLTPNSL
ncbi:MAG: 30S ribosomal protein S20 [Patescibacteria group bacterium]